MKLATPQDVQNLLAVDDDRLAELRKEQDKYLKRFRSRARLTPLERKLGRAVELERHYRTIGNMDGLAEALAEQGRFRAAAEVAVRDDLRAVLLEKAEAVEKPDTNCLCPDFDEDGIPNQYIQANVIRNGELVPAIRCKVCGDLNVRAIPVHLAEQRAARAQSAKGKEIRAEDFFKNAG